MSPWKGWEHFAPGAVTALRTSKYGNRATVVDGLRFDSKREAARYNLLKVRLHAGDIRGLKCQPSYPLCPLVLVGADVRELSAGSATLLRHPIAEYVADFEYEESDRHAGLEQWTLVVEDSKGVRTETFKLKKKWFEAQYGIRIREV